MGIPLFLPMQLLHRLSVHIYFQRGNTEFHNVDCTGPVRTVPEAETNFMSVHHFFLGKVSYADIQDSLDLLPKSTSQKVPLCIRNNSTSIEARNLRNFLF